MAEVGTASCCIALEGGIPVAAKTGTAQLNGPGEPERSHAWIVAFAPADAPQYAVAVMLKGTNAEISASTGGRLAGPIAKAMLDEVFAIAPPARRRRRRRRHRRAPAPATTAPDDPHDAPRRPHGDRLATATPPEHAVRRWSITSDDGPCGVRAARPRQQP